jgi:hypothetical protein
MAGKNDPIFLLCPRILVDTGIEMVMPPLTTLLSNAT